MVNRLWYYYSHFYVGLPLLSKVKWWWKTHLCLEWRVSGSGGNRAFKIIVDFHSFLWFNGHFRCTIVSVKFNFNFFWDKSVIIVHSETNKFSYPLILIYCWESLLFGSHSIIYIKSASGIMWYEKKINNFDLIMAQTSRSYIKA